ncbi:ribbon-helix-helix domain-containing protein [Patescibacteria group bacterium]|nr:ribbon-helix-helix domain-containing protein [Patescibacteria group bacterium]
MNTVNISLTQNQVNQVNQATINLGFANRSEFFRALLRKTLSNPIALEEVKSYPFISPITKNSQEIVSSFKKTNKYSTKFLNDLKEGLEDSPYFQ